jgi:hypothetical protein
MRTELTAKAYVGIILGFIVHVIAGAIAQTSKEGQVIGLVIGIGALALFVWGCMNLALAKGYSKWVGLLGILTCIGFIILILMPDRSRRLRRF